MSRKMLFFDIDGTLITEGSGKMPESTKSALKEAKEQGHLLFINTGRTKANLPEKILEMGFDGCICGCGTNIFLKDEEIFVSRLSNELCKEVVRKIREHHVQAFYEASEAVYFDYETPNAEKWVKAVEEMFSVKGRNIEEVLRSETLVYDKILMFLEPTKENQRLKEYLSETFICIDRNKNIYEVIQKDYSKGTGIQFLCDYLGNRLEDCYAFGDSENDRAMLEAVPNSIAMGNGAESIKRTCSYVTDSVLENGIYNAMKHFGLI